MNAQLLLPLPPSYFNVHDALAECQPVRVRFNESIQPNPWLEEGVEKGSVQEIPLWMAMALEDRVTLLPPRQFSSRVRDDLQAGADSVNLRDLSPQFYRFGLKIYPLMPGSVCSILQMALTARLKRISQPLLSPSASTAVVPIDTSTTNLRGIYQVATGPVARMDQLEQDLYELAKRTRREQDAWWRRETLKIRKYGE